MKTHKQMFSAAMFIIVLVLIASPVAALETARSSVSTASVESNNNSFLPALNGNGQFVVFHSFANNLVPGDTNGVRDVFVRNRQTGETTRVSVVTGGAQGNSTSRVGDLSKDGNLVSFESDATNLVLSDTNAKTDIFVHDRQTVTTTRVSVGTGAVQANGDSFNAALSGDGRFVAFESDATNLVAGDTNGVSDIFVHDRQTGETTRVSVATGAVQADGGSFFPVLSGDGRFVAFESNATNLVAGDTNAANDIFVHDRQTGETTRVSVATGAIQGDDSSFLPDISEDGRFVVFESEATNLVAGDTNGFDDVFRHDRQTGTTVRVSVPTGGSPQANEDSVEAVVSGDGRFVAFLSFASNLVSGDTNADGDVFVHDTQTNTTTRMSVSTGGVQGNDFSCNPAISQDGRIVAFFSDSTNLVPGDTNGTRDIFTRDRTVCFDLDGDGKADMVWRDTTTTVVAGWLMNGSTILSSTFFGGVPGEWRVAGIGDVNGDGEADVVWHNTSIGITAIWFMNGLTITGVAFPGGVSTDWEVVAVGDVDGDGTADILWRNTVDGVVALWLMKNGAIAVSGFLGGVPLEWHIAGLADVNGDGKADVLWGNSSSFLTATWLMNGLTIMGVTFPATLSAEWDLLGTGDFNGDGTADLFWYNNTSGVVVVWVMSGGTIASSGNVGSFPLNVKIVRVEDTNGDGGPDLVLMNTTTGEISVALASIGTSSTGVMLPNDWEIQP